MSFMDELRISAALRNLATELQLDGDKLIEAWRARREALISTGKSSTAAANAAYFEIVQAERARAVQRARALAQARARRP